MTHKNALTVVRFLLVLVACEMNVLPLKAENVDPLDQGFHYAYGENIGWSNFKPTAGEGVTITDTQALGYVWSENIGWINLSPDNGGVVNDGIGHLSGWAWGENVGWISFSCRETNSCENIPYGVSVDPATGIFGGYAWGENIGWITFESLSPGIVILQTAWRDNVLPGDINDDTSANILDALIGLQICAGMRPPVVVHLLADINNDSKIGLAEVIHAMQYEAGLRP